MALRFVDGFDWQAAVADNLMKWSAQDTTSASLQTGRLGGQCLRHGNYACYLHKVLDAQGTWVVGVAYRQGVACNRDIYPILLWTGSTFQCGVKVNTGTNTLSCYSASTLATSANVIGLNTWYYIEFKCTIGNAGTYEVRVNGSSVGWIPSANGDTQNHASTTTADKVQIGGSASSWSVTNTLDYDDIYIADGTAGINDFLGDTRVQTVLPGADGTHTDFTASAGNDFECVNELYDGDTTYLYSSTAGHMNTFNMDDIVAGYTIKGIGINGIMRKTDAGARTMRTFYEDSGGTHRNGTTQSVGTSYVNYQQLVEVDPVTTSAFDVTGVNAIRPGVEIVA